MKLNCALTRLPLSELIPIHADYPKLPLASGGAAVTLNSFQGLILQGAHSRKHAYLRTQLRQKTAPKAASPEVCFSVLLRAHLGLQERSPWITPEQPGIWALLPAKDLTLWPSSTAKTWEPEHGFPVHKLFLCSVCVSATATTEPTGPVGVARVKAPYIRHSECECNI